MLLYKNISTRRELFNNSAVFVQSSFVRQTAS